MPLTDTQIKTTKPTDKAQKLFDADGLFLFIPPTGSKLWRVKYRYQRKEKLLALGKYPAVSLKEARHRTQEARKLLAQGIDPASAKKAAREQAAAEARTFETVARQWHKKYFPTWTPGHADEILRRLERHIFPHIGGKPIDAVTPSEVLEPIRQIESAGILETAHRVLGICGQVFRYAVANAWTVSDPCRDLRGALPPKVKKHHATITEPAKVGALLRAIDDFSGSLVVRGALRLAPLVFVRPGELRGMRWCELALDKAEWRIPAGRMKMREQHIVPLSRQALTILEEMKLLSWNSAFVFPNARSPLRCMSDAALVAALRRMGYDKSEMTAHGFRSMASTLLNEQGYNRDWIERQLAHAPRDGVRASYNFAEHLPERREMMQKWADYLEELKQRR